MDWKERAHQLVDEAGETVHDGSRITNAESICNTTSAILDGEALGKGRKRLQIPKEKALSNQLKLPLYTAEKSDDVLNISHPKLSKHVDLTDFINKGQYEEVLPHLMIANMGAQTLSENSMTRKSWPSLFSIVVKPLDVHDRIRLLYNIGKDKMKVEARSVHSQGSLFDDGSELGNIDHTEYKYHVLHKRDARDLCGRFRKRPLSSIVWHYLYNQPKDPFGLDAPVQDFASYASFYDAVPKQYKDVLVDRLAQDKSFRFTKADFFARNIEHKHKLDEKIPVVRSMYHFGNHHFSTEQLHPQLHYLVHVLYAVGVDPTPVIRHHRIRM